MRESTRIGEYPSIVTRAAKEGWLQPLMTTHTTVCSIIEAVQILRELPLPKNLRVYFRPGRGRAKHRMGVYAIHLPKEPGTRAGKLRVGLVLHEAAHVMDHVRNQKFGHGERFCAVLEALVKGFNWRKVMCNYSSIYDRHRGPYCIMLIRETKGKGDKVTASTETLGGPYSAEEAHEEARMLATDPRENVVSAYVYSLTEQQHIGAIYKRGETYRSWRDEILALPAAEPATEVVSVAETTVEHLGTPQTEPSKPWAATQPRAMDRPRKRGVSLGVGKDDGWPRSEAAQAIRAFFDKTPTAAPAEIIDALGTKLNELGVAHPASLVSRLKQAGFLKEIAA